MSNNEILAPSVFSLLIMPISRSNMNSSASSLQLLIIFFSSCSLYLLPFIFVYSSFPLSFPLFAVFFNSTREMKRANLNNFPTALLKCMFLMLMLTRTYNYISRFRESFIL